MKRLAYLIVVLGLLVWAVPAFLRDSAVPFAGPAAYEVADDVVHWQGTLVSQGHVVSSMSAIAALSGAPPFVALRLLGLLAGVAGGIGLWLMLKRLQFPYVTALLALTLYAVSSLSISLFAVPSSLGFAVGFAMLATGLLMQPSLLLGACGMLAAIVAALASPVACLHTIAMTCGLLLWQRRRWRALVVAAVLVMAALIAWQQAPRLQFEWVTPVIGVLAELGKPPGLGAMEWVIAVLGIAGVWASAGFLVVIAVAYASVTTVGAAFALPLWVALGAIEIMQLYQRKWRVDLMRWDVLLFVTLAVLLATFIVGSSVVKSEPTPLLVNGLTQLKESNTVLVYGPVVPYLRYWSDAKVVVGSDELWYGRDIQNTTVVLSERRVDSIIITRQMREGQVWTKEEEGLLFLLKNSEMFKRRFNNAEVEIWSFAPISNG